MQRKESNKENKFNNNNQGLTSGAPTASVSKDIFGAGRRIQELRNRLVKLSKNTSHEKTILGLRNIYQIAVITTRKKYTLSANAAVSIVKSCRIILLLL